MSGVAMKTGPIACGRENTIADIATFLALETMIGKHIGIGVTSIQTLSSELMFVSLDSSRSYAELPNALA